MKDTEQLLEWDRVISQALDKRPGESIVDAARRVMTSPHGHRAWRVAAVFTSPRRGARFAAWAEMRTAAKIARRLTSQAPGATKGEKA